MAEIWSKEKARQAADLINDAFAWETTAEGSDFWMDVQAKLEAIADGEQDEDEDEEEEDEPPCDCDICRDARGELDDDDDF